ncbi:bola-like protein [Mycena pura]|uniref:Bola-like protein n=1 Tax=Mycena pura TaxID=153505 RepID=A0AAD6VP51_9AGAR|nr:bola-like protein [Mycena pura]
MSITTHASAGPIETAIREKLTAALNPTVLKISNDSWQHRHHAAMRAIGSDGSGETHFSVQIVASAFQSKTTIQRHRMIHNALRDEFDGGLHSLSLQTKTAEEIEQTEQSRDGV